MEVDVRGIAQFSSTKLSYLFLADTRKLVCLRNLINLKDSREDVTYIFAKYEKLHQELLASINYYHLFYRKSSHSLVTQDTLPTISAIFTEWSQNTHNIHQIFQSQILASIHFIKEVCEILRVQNKVLVHSETWDNIEFAKEEAQENAINVLHKYNWRID